MKDQSPTLTSEYGTALRPNSSYISSAESTSSYASSLSSASSASSSGSAVESHKPSFLHPKTNPSEPLDSYQQYLNTQNYHTLRRYSNNPSSTLVPLRRLPARREQIRHAVLPSPVPKKGVPVLRAAARPRQALDQVQRQHQQRTAHLRNPQQRHPSLRCPRQQCPRACHQRPPKPAHNHVWARQASCVPGSFHLWRGDITCAQPG